MNPKLKASLKPLLGEWAKEPAKFFEPWSLQPKDAKQASLDIDEANGLATETDPDDLVTEAIEPSIEADDPTTAVDDLLARNEGLREELQSVLETKVLQIRGILLRKHAESIRWIFNTLFFYDLLMLFTSRDPDGDTALPKGKNLKILAKKALDLLSANIQLGDELVNWAKTGYVYHLVGRILGEGSWFLIAESLSVER